MGLIRSSSTREMISEADVQFFFFSFFYSTRNLESRYIFLNEFSKDIFKCTIFLLFEIFITGGKKVSFSFPFLRHSVKGL